MKFKIYTESKISYTKTGKLYAQYYLEQLRQRLVGLLGTIDYLFVNHRLPRA